MNCKYCKDGAFNILIESEKIYLNRGWRIGGIISESDVLEIDNSVVMEIRSNQGYIRLGDSEDMNCLEHGDKLKINYCPMCGEIIK